MQNVLMIKRAMTAFAYQEERMVTIMLKTGDVIYLGFDHVDEASVAIHDLAGHSGCVMLAADSQIRVKSSGR